MIVCVCHRVSDRTILAHAQSGKNFDEIQWDLQVGLQCGNCEGCARELVASCHCVPTPVAADGQSSVNGMNLAA